MLFRLAIITHHAITKPTKREARTTDLPAQQRAHSSKINLHGEHRRDEGGDTSHECLALRPRFPTVHLSRMHLHGSIPQLAFTSLGCVNLLSRRDGFLDAIFLGGARICLETSVLTTCMENEPRTETRRCGCTRLKHSASKHDSTVRILIRREFLQVDLFPMSDQRLHLFLSTSSDILARLRTLKERFGTAARSP